MIESMILESIDNINNEVENSSFHVLESMVALYSKEIDFMDFCSPELKQEIVMEGSILDNVKKASKKDSNKLITFLAFIPRLIKEICKAIAKSFSDKDLGKKLKTTGDKLNKLGSASEKKAKVDEINEKEGKEVLVYDEKSGKIKFNKTWADALGAVVWLASTFDILFNLFKNIKAEFDVTNPSAIRTFIDECDKIIRKKSEHKASEVINMGVDALGDVVRHITGSAGALAAAGAAASSIVGKKLTELKLNGEKEEDHAVLVNIKELSNKLAIINAAIFAGTKIMDVAKKIGGYIGLGVEVIENNKSENLEARADIFKDIQANHPEIIDAIERKEGMSDADYHNLVVQAYYKSLHPDKPEKPDADADPETMKQYRKDKKEYYKEMNKDLRSGYKEARKKIDERHDAEEAAAKKKYRDDKKKFHKENPIFGRKKNKSTQESAEIEVNDDEAIIDEMTEEELMERYKKDPDIEFIEGKPYSKNFLGSLRGGPPTKKQEEFSDKIDKSVLSRPLFNKKAAEYWKNHPEERDIEAKYGTTGYKEQVEDELEEE